MIQKLPPSSAITRNESVPPCGVANASGRYAAGSGVKPAIPTDRQKISKPWSRYADSVGAERHPAIIARGYRTYRVIPGTFVNCWIEAASK